MAMAHPVALRANLHERLARAAVPNVHRTTAVRTREPVPIHAPLDAQHAAPTVPICACTALAHTHIQQAHRAVVVARSEHIPAPAERADAVRGVVKRVRTAAVEQGVERGAAVAVCSRVRRGPEQWALVVRAGRIPEENGALGRARGKPVVPAAAHTTPGHTQAHIPTWCAAAAGIPGPLDDAQLTEAAVGDAAEEKDVLGGEVLVVHVVRARDGDEVAAGPRDGVRERIVGDAGPVEREQALLRSREVCGHGRDLGQRGGAVERCGAVP